MQSATSVKLPLLSCKNEEEWSSPSTWKEIVSGLSITDEDAVDGLGESSSLPSETHSKGKPTINDQSRTTDMRKELVEDGYTLVRNDSHDASAGIISVLVKGITQLHKKGLPATFILLFDEAWQLAKIGNKSLKASGHSKNVFNFDILAWYIDPSEGVAGFSPHRDRQPERRKEIENSFHSTGEAKYVTMWMALTDATPENSCLYVIPKPFDPGYIAGDDDGEDGEEGRNGTGTGVDNNPPALASDPLSRALKTKQSYQNIRALPRNSGESVIFTHRILHWGSKGNQRCINKPRIAISFVSSDPSFEKPYLRHRNKYWCDDKSSEASTSASASSRSSTSLPPFYIRLLLVCAQLLIYYQRFDLPKDTIRACYEYCKEHNEELDEAYYKKVSIEFVKAMREETQETNLVSKNDDVEVSKCSIEEGEAGGVNDADDDEAEEALLQAMLENASEGDFSDDYDEMVEGEGEEDDGDDDGDEELIFGEDEEDLADISLIMTSGMEPEKKKRKL